MSSCFLRCFFLLLESKLKSIASKLKSIESNLKWIWSWYTIVWFVWGYTIVSSCFLRWFCFLTFPLHFPLLKFVSVYLASFFLESKPKAFWRISFSQAKKTWMIMIHNSMVCLRVHYCVQLLPEVIFFFYLKVNWNQLQVTWNQLKVTWNEYDHDTQ